MSKPLFEDNGESENEADFKLGTNKEYAKVYNDFRKKELLKKIKDRGYNNITEENSSDESDSSSEEDEEVNVEFDREFFTTLASLKSKDPSIYDKNTRFFTSLPDSDTTDENKTKLATEKESNKSKKPVTLKDYERKVILEHNGKFEDSDEEEELKERPASPTAVDEERRLKAEFKKALNAEESEDEEFGGVFKKRVKSKEEKKQEEEDFAEWLVGKKAEIEGKAKEKLEPLKHYWSQRNLPQSERFLRDYILSKGYSNTKSSDIPTYDEIVGEGDNPQELSDDEKELEKQAEFEEKYNFRFEEPDTDFIKRFPRTIENSVRLDEGKRKEKRIELKKRKQEEKEQKMKELEILKEMKRKEIEDKIEKLKKVTGNEELGFNDKELEEDFDPEAHDRRMRQLFNEEYYQVDEGEEKPECPSDIDELKVEDWDNYDPKQTMYDDNDYEPHCEDDEFNMDCEYDPEAAKQQFQQELIENTKRRKNRRGRRNRFMEMIQHEKPPFNPEDEKTYGEYIEEYYKMDCEDIIDDLPCRFKYVETAPNDFGLTIEEILLAKNKELNQWASLKKTLQIRPDQVEKRDQRLYKLKAKNEALKRKIFKSLYGENSDDDDENEDEDEKTTENTTIQNSSQPDDQRVSTEVKKSKKKRKTKKSEEIEKDNSIAVSEANKPKIENPFLEKDDMQSKVKNSTPLASVSSVDIKKKKKKKKKKIQISATVPNPNNAEQPKSSGETSVSPKKTNNTIEKKPHSNSDNSANPKKTQKQNPFTTSEVLKKTQKSNPFAAKRENNQLKFENKKSKLNLNHKSKTQFKPSKKKITNAKFTNSNQVQINDERLKAYNINPRKFHKKQKFGKKATAN